MSEVTNCTSVTSCKLHFESNQSQNSLRQASYITRAGRLYQLKTIKQNSKIYSWISDGYHYANFGQIGRSPETRRTKRLIVNLINITSTTSELTKKQVPGSQLNFCLLNARSVNNKTLEIKDYTIDKDVDLFAITESWLKADESSDFVSRDIASNGYGFLHCPRPNGTGGGLAVLYKSTMKIELLKTPQPYKSFELMELLLHSFTTKANMIIYRPPPSSNNQLTPSLFFDKFLQLLECSVSSPGQLLLCRDFNFHVEHPSDHNTRKFLDLLHCFNLDTYNDHASTHKDNHDLVIGRSDENLVADFHVHDPTISDHFAIHCKLNSYRPPNPRKQCTYRKLCSVNTDAFRQDILSSELLSTNSSDLNSLCSRYDDVISAIVDKHAPLVTKTITVGPNSAWYTDDIGVEKSTRRRFERPALSSKLPEHRQNIAWHMLLNAGLVLNAKTKYYSNLISESSSNSKALFQTIDQLLHRKPETRLPYAPSPLHLANQFGDLFLLKISNIRDELLPVEVPAYFSSLNTVPIFCHLDT